MSINSHLSNTASKLIISDPEYAIIDGHIDSLKRKINNYFPSSVIEHFPFGSYTRRTLMPRRADDKSDVDYMIVFRDNNNSTATYLNWLKNFAKEKYYSSEIYQSHPTVVLELSRIKIEIVPAVKSNWDNYMIPASASNYQNWLTTHPNAFNTLVRDKNTSEKSLIRPLIRLMKYWNAKNGYIFSSYELENLIVGRYYMSCNTLWDYLNTFVNLMPFNSVSWKSDRITRLKETCKSALSLEYQGYPVTAEIEIKKVFPEY